MQFAIVTTNALGTTSALYAYVTGDVVKSQDADDDNKYYVEIPVGENETLTTKSMTTGGDVITAAYALQEGDVIEYKLNADGKVESVTKYAMNALAASSGAGNFTAAIVAVEDDNVRFSNDYFTDDQGNKAAADKTYEATLTDDTVIIYVDSSENEVAEGGSIQIANENVIEVNHNNVTAYYANVMVKTNASSEVVLLVVDVNNDILDIQ